MKKVLSSFIALIMVFSILQFFPQNQSLKTNAASLSAVQITPVSSNFDKKAGKQKDIKITFTPVTTLLNSITNGTAVLVKGTDYVVSGNTVTIKSSYLSLQPGGKTTLSLSFGGGITLPVTINVYNSTFIRAVGTQFYNGDNTFYFAGANAYQLFTKGDGWNDSTADYIENDYMNKSQIDSLLDQMQADGVKVLRTWGFNHADGVSTWHVFEPKKGVFNEAEFMEFDYIMESAKKHGMKVIITLENYWKDYGGIDSILQWEGLPINKDESTAESNTLKTAFYKDANCKADYKAYAEHFVNRVNHYTGIKYKDDPTIFSWELMNEPCYTNAPAGDDGSAFLNWVNEMAKYIKGFDSNHMVSSGSGSAMDVTHTSPYVDFVSAHPYPDEKWSNLTPDQVYQAEKSWINNAHNVLKKPFIIEEFNSHENKDLYWPAVMKPIEELDAGGFMFWNYNSNRDDNFTMLHGDSQINDLYIPFSQRMEAKNAAKNTLDNSSVIFDRYSSNQADVNVTLNFLTGSTLSSIKSGTTALINGTDYTISGTKVTLKKSFLSKLPFGNSTLTFNASSGVSPALNVYVFDSSILNPVISTDTASFDKNTVRRKDVTVSISSNGNTFKSITNGTKTLVNGIDYIVSGETYIIKKGYLATLPIGKSNLTFNFDKGVSPSIAITITDTTGQEIIDSFESYSGIDASVQAAYTRVIAGGPISLSLSSTYKNTGSYGLRVDYDVSTGYCGVIKKIDGFCGTGYNGLSFWIQPDGSNRDLTVQVKENSGEYWESSIKLSGTTASTVFVPFSSFKIPSWYTGGGDGVLDLTSIAEYNMYVGQGLGATGTGTIYLDDIKFASDKSAIKYGDLNGDNKINVQDYLLLKRYINKVITEFPSSDGITAADLNGDGNIDNSDYTLLRYYLIHKISSFPVQ
ncbi:MAG: X2-like carbohydrate binding domain-containing protein [Bacillota bacterium]|nr:X2-like carbohydrate binding domain-containing protein [Bacillota bacterium]